MSIVIEVAQKGCNFSTAPCPDGTIFFENFWRISMTTDILCTKKVLNISTSLETFFAHLYADRHFVATFLREVGTFLILAISANLPKVD